MERAASGQTAVFPLPLLVRILNSTDSKYVLAGSEEVAGTNCSHVTVWNSFDSHPKLQFLSEFTRKDIWIETNSGLIRKLSFEVRDASGAAPRTSFDFYYNNYRPVAGSLYPSNVAISMNGSPWMTINIQNVLANTGVSDSAFQIQ